MKIIIYNLNGLRAANKLTVLNWIKQEDADIICLQEVRAEQNVCEEILRRCYSPDLEYSDHLPVILEIE